MTVEGAASVPTDVAHDQLLASIIAKDESSSSGVPILPARADITGTHRKILEAALRLFAERGYYGVSVRDISTEVGIRPSSIYAHVATKEDLLIELFRIGHAEHWDRMVASVELGASPGEQMDAIVRSHVRMHAELPLLARVSNRELGAVTGPARDEALQVRLKMERLLISTIEAGQRSGDFAADVDVLLCAAAIGAMGIRVAEWWRPDLGISIDLLCDQYATFALRMLRP